VGERVAGALPPPPRGRPLRRPLWPFAFVAPSVAAIGLVFVYPLVMVVKDSFYAGSATFLTYVGTANYRAVFADPVFVTSLLNNLKLMVTVPVMTVLALATAIFLNDRVRGWRAYRAIVFFPYVLPATAIGIAFSYLLQRNGTLNTLLRDIGAHSLALDWLGSAHVVIFSIGGVIIWQQLGFGVVVFSAALLALPPEVTEAALIDGANWWQLQTRVLLPQIRRTIEFFVVIELITVLSWVFNYVYVLTQGGPGNSSSVMEYYIWNNGFSIGSIGLASSVAVLLLGMASILIAIYFRVRERGVEA
jgi:ABC-type sugar transport system permease subunit